MRSTSYFRNTLLLTFLFVCNIGRAELRNMVLGNGNISVEVCYDAAAGAASLKSVSCPQSGMQWKVAESQPLFVLNFSGRTVSSMEGWSDIRVQKKGKSAKLLFLSEDSLHIEICMDWRKELHIRWGECRLPAKERIISAVLFPLRFHDLPSGTKAFYPYASGIVYEPAIDRIESAANYPAGFGASMPWFALWDSGTRSLYYAAHDRRATMKTLKFEIKDERCVNMEFCYPACQPEGSRPSVTPCDIVLSCYSGDWFDAAQIYKKWMQKESFWYASVKTGKQGRSDTPGWMKELCVWATGTDEQVMAFRREIGIPAGFHWYNWHQIPFDNDYPHYIPAREHFTEKVQQLQAEGVYVMPYINGRLWDTHDHGLRDSLFTSYALPAASKNREGEPNIEDYGSKEADGSSVKLAVMCPSTHLWQEKVKDVVLKLLTHAERAGYGVDAVYIDQIAAAPPVACWDRVHSHPAGGGDWWVPAYTELLQAIRREMPQGKMLTTESNADGYAGIVDGFLTWQFQDNKQVPAFAAVYGGMVQLFGRSYAPESETLQATRMKMLQSLIFGEQLGWMSASILNDKDRFPLLKSLAQLRYRFREYFYKGEMVHAPQLIGDNPLCKDVWYFNGARNIEMPSVICSAWQKLDKRSAIVMLGNCSDEARELRIVLSSALTSLAGKRVVRYGSDGSLEPLGRMPQSITVPSGSAVVYEFGF